MSVNPLSDALDRLIPKAAPKAPPSPEVVARAQQILQRIDHQKEPEHKEPEHQKKADDPANDDHGRTNLRTPLEAMSSSAEDINAENNLGVLARLFPRAEATRDATQRDIERLLAHGTSGSYVTRTPTLLQKVRALR